MRKRSKRFSGKAIREALKRTRGNVSLAATMLFCSRETIYQHTTADERKAIKDEAYSDLVDMAETMLTQAVNRGEKWAVQFTLERMGRERGWGASEEHNVTIYPPAHIVFTADPPVDDDNDCSAVS